MRTPAPVLLPILRSQVQGHVLATTFLNPSHEFSITELAGLSGASVNAAQREVARLLDAGLLTSRRVGTSRYVRAMTDSVIAAPLTDLMAVTYGPKPVLTRVLAPLDGINSAFIYGSWAARYAGEKGPVPGDVDLLVVGVVDPDALDSAVEEAQTLLRREVNATRVLPERWDEAEDPFLKEVRRRPLVELPLRGGAER